MLETAQECVQCEEENLDRRGPILLVFFKSH